MAMNQNQRTHQVWSLLMFAAVEQKIVGYKMLHKLTGLPIVGTGPELGEIYWYCEQNDLPKLNVLAVNQTEGDPSPDFLEGIDVAKEHRKIFAFDWLEYNVKFRPNEDDFREARAKHESAHV